MSTRLAIEPLGLHWLCPEQSERDLCAHGGVRVTFDGKEVFLSDADLTVSAGALYLLRSLEDDHLSSQEDHLFPHCAHGMAIIADRVVNVSGCGSGDDWKIAHSNDDVTLSFYGCATIQVSKSEWRRAVADFSAAVRAFYFAEPRLLGVDAGEWHAAFVDEWDRRHKAALR